jgi:outer membrane protein TolC
LQHQALFELAVVATAMFAPAASAATQPQVLTPEFVAVLGLQSSDDVRSVQNEISNRTSQALRVDSQFATKLDAKISAIDNRNEPSQPTSPDRTRSEQLVLGVSRAFETGTIARLELQSSRRSLEGISLGATAPGAPAEIDISGYESVWSASVRQSLLKNSFGRASRLQQTANAMAAESAELGAQDRLENIALQYVAGFYRAWQAQLQAIAAEERLNRQKRLLSVTKIKANRGTAEQPDVLQVSAAVSLSEERLKDARKAVTDIWQYLVLSLNLPAEYAAMDAMKIPLALGNAVAAAEKSCASQLDESSPRVKSLIKAKDAAEKSLAAVADSTRPDVFLELRYSPNGVDPTRTETIQEASAGKHPSAAIALGVEMTLSHYREEADKLDLLRQRNAAEIRLSQLQTQFKIDRDALCRDMERLKEKTQTLAAVLDTQKTRERAEEERFRLGA